MDLLWVLEGYVEPVQTHEPWIEEFMNLEGEQRAEDEYGPWMALVCLFEFNISWIFPEDC